MNLLENILLLDNETKTFFTSAYGALLWWLLASLGLTFGITHSKLLRRFRGRESFAHCPQCVGFWVGPLIYFLDSGLINLFFSSSFICMAVYLVMAKSIKTHY